ncbi:hypothetical protein [Camelliibacillus cellulosilyticus]|uniref:hypothetical protein n=1 Tax=Camelliibacillus cellulosilyticus TaxID=2174486 RepID=UPI00366D75AB
MREQIYSFVLSQIGFPQFKKLEREFKTRLRSSGLELQLLPPLKLNYAFDIWLNFIYVYKNGNRAVEWFFETHGHTLSPGEKKGIEAWLHQTPALVQTVDQNKKGVWFEDCLSGRRFFIPRMGLVTDLTPWGITYALFAKNPREGFQTEGSFCFAPNLLPDLLEKVTELAKQTSRSPQTVLRENYPEIIAHFFIKQLMHDNEMEEVEWTLVYKMEDRKEVIWRWTQRHEWQLHPEENCIPCIYQWYRYDDSEVPAPIYIGQIEDRILIKGDQFIFKTRDKDKMHSFQIMAHEEFRSIMTLVDRRCENMSLNLWTNTHSFLIKRNGKVPDYFYEFAAKRVLNHDLVTKPLPCFNLQSPKDLMNNGHHDWVECYLRHAEYDENFTMRLQYPKETVTPDYNVFRKALDLPFSPFVTGGKSRLTSLTPIDPPNLNDPSQFMEVALTAVSGEVL